MTDRFPRLPAYAAGAFAFVLLTLGQLALPSSASALPNPLDLVPSGLPNLDPTSWVVDGFKAILVFIFGDPSELGRHLVNLLLALPILTDKKSFPDLNDYRSFVTGGAWGILGLSFVVASLRYWLSSYSGSGAYEAIQGFVKTVAAIVILLAFPIAFDQCVRLANALTAALVSAPAIKHGLSHGLVGTLSTAPMVGGGMAMFIAIASIIMAMILLVVKVIVTALLAVLFVASPLAIAVWPIEEAAWLLRSLLQSIAALLLFPILWAICFATFAVLNNDALFPGNHGDLLNSILSPLIVLASLIIAYRLPFAVLQQAMQAGIAPGISRGVTHIVNVQRVTGRGGGGARPKAPAAAKTRLGRDPVTGRFTSEWI